MYKSQTGGWYTRSLFWDTWSNMAISQRHCEPKFTFNSDRPGMVNCKKTFVALGDPTGYQWAMKYLESYDHWIALNKAPWFQEQVEIWVNELNQKLKSEAIQRIQRIAEESTNETQALAASKYLAERAYDKSKAGRPSKEQQRGEMKRLVAMAETQSEDAERIGLTVISGGKS